jgi:UDPglucose 6-dehydrogenase
MKIAIAGTGYVGLSNAVLLAQHNEVVAIDIVAEKVAMLNRQQSPIVDADIEDYLQHKQLKLRATLDKADAYREAELIIIATPTDYDPATNTFNTRSVEAVIEEVLAINRQALMVIKSTVPVGYHRQAETAESGCLHNHPLLAGIPARRRGTATTTCYPSRIVVGERSARAENLCPPAANREP